MGQVKSKSRKAQSPQGKAGEQSPELLRSKQIDDSLKVEKQSQHDDIKLLLLGAGESGKSTVFKQMQIIHNNGFTLDQKKGHCPAIRRHCLENLRDLVNGAARLELLPESTVQLAEDLLEEVETRGVQAKHIEAINEMWRSQELQDAFAARNKFQLCDSAKFFLNHVERIMDVEYLPTYEDILMCRVRTTGVSEMQFSTAGVNFRVVDVGGQRSERRKWIHCFDDVEAVLFVAAISEYDQVLFEDDCTNRLKEALSLFEEVCNTRFFSGTSMILFLNKKDLFEEKIANISLDVCFPEYTGGCNVAAAIAFVKQQFMDKRTNKSQEVFVHVTTATDTGNMTFVFDSVKESILLQNVNGSGIF